MSIDMSTDMSIEMRSDMNTDRSAAMDINRNAAPAPATIPATTLATPPVTTPATPPATPPAIYREKVLVVEDDKQIQRFICFALKNEGFVCVTAYTGNDALRLLVAESCDIMLLDLGLPDIDGMTVIKRVREWSEMPILVVSARDQDREKVIALDNGADDYLTKPFSATELLARIRVALRHLHRQERHTAYPTLSVGDLQIDLNKRLVFLAGTELHVTPMEYALLSLFFKNIGKVLTTGLIIREIWGAGYGTDTQALRALMAGLRRKIEKVPAKPRYIKTEIGVGYRLSDT